MAPSNNAVHTEQIVRDITGSILCSYQIAHKYGLTKMTVDRIARTHLGEEIYQKKEHLALELLKEEFFKLKSQGLSIHNIGLKLGLSKASSFNLAKRFEGEGCDSCDDEVIQIESIPQVVNNRKCPPSLQQITLIATNSTQKIGIVTVDKY